MPHACLARRDFGHMAEGGVLNIALPTGLGGHGMLVMSLFLFSWRIAFCVCYQTCVMLTPFGSSIGRCSAALALIGKSVPV